jgi:CheY-like chemotaxis protein
MPEEQTGIDADSEFVRLVRSALAHLYDPAYLQNHPLVSVLELGVDSDHVTRAQAMRRVLLECIEAFRPEAQDQDQAKAARAYAILTYRYVDGLSVEEIADKLALSRRQVYREHRKGLEAVASLLQGRMRGRGRGEDITGDRLEAVQAEVAHLRQAVHPEFLSLQVVLEEICRLLAPVIGQTGAQVRMASPETWPSVVADRVILRQTLLNLLSYALHVARSDLIITASHGREGLLIDISESPGGDEVRATSSPSPDLKPDEVSLAVAEALLEVQSGYVEMYEREGRWCAQVVLPTAGLKTVLVVDDNTDVVALFRRYLGGHQVQVIGAIDGEQALHLAGEMQPQAITLDVMMPNQDGWEILQKLKTSSSTQHIPVIVCSVLNEPHLATAMGASDYITKPVSQVELLEVLQRWMGSLQPIA